MSSTKPLCLPILGPSASVSTPSSLLTPPTVCHQQVFQKCNECRSFCQCECAWVKKRVFWFHIVHDYLESLLSSTDYLDTGSKIHSIIPFFTSRENEKSQISNKFLLLRINIFPEWQIVVESESWMTEWKPHANKHRKQLSNTEQSRQSPVASYPSPQTAWIPEIIKPVDIFIILDSIRKPASKVWIRF